jgi:mutator protein MutT
VLGVGALIFRRNAILLVERGTEPLKGQWSLPGGGVETGEILESAIRREVREETGLEIQPQGVFEIFERILLDENDRPEYHYVLVDYLCKVKGGTLAAGSDVSRVEWVPRRDLSQYTLTEGTLAVIERAFACRKPARHSPPAPSSSSSKN